MKTVSVKAAPKNVTPSHDLPFEPAQNQAIAFDWEQNMQKALSQ
jgi:hypothetical protein